MIDFRKKVLTIDDTHGVNLILAEMIAYHKLQDATIFFASFNDNNQPNSIVQRLSAMGFTIGSHTVNHPHLSNIPIAEAIKEIRESKSHIEIITAGKPCNYFAYPFGDYNQQITQEVIKAGYLAARTCIPDGGDGFNQGSFYLDGLQERFELATKTHINIYHIHAISIENFNSFSDFNTFLKWMAKENNL